MRKKIALIIGIVFFTLTFSNEKELVKDYKLGDKIVLKIENSSETDIRESFKEFDIEGIKLDETSQDKRAYIVTMRSYDLGEKTINYNGEKIKLNILTNLQEGDKEILLDYSDESIKKWREPFPYTILLGILSLIGALWFLLKKIKVDPILTPYEKYKEKMKNLTENYPFEISYALREYLDSQFNTNFLQGKYNENFLIAREDINFLKELDYVKFSHKKTMTFELAKERGEKIVEKIFTHFQKEREKEIESKRSKCLIERLKEKIKFRSKTKK